MKGKSSIWIAQNVERKMRNFLGNKFWARRYFVTTVGRDDEVIRAYIRNQELADQQLDQLELKILSRPKIRSITQHPLKPPLAVPNQTSSFAGGYWLASRKEDQGRKRLDCLGDQPSRWHQLVVAPCRSGRGASISVLSCLVSRARKSSIRSTLLSAPSNSSRSRAGSWGGAVSPFTGCTQGGIGASSAICSIARGGHRSRCNPARRRTAASR